MESVGDGRGRVTAAQFRAALSVGLPDDALGRPPPGWSPPSPGGSPARSGGDQGGSDDLDPWHAACANRLFDRIDVARRGAITFDNVSDFVVHLEANAGGSSAAGRREKWALGRSGESPAAGPKTEWHAGGVDRATYVRGLDKVITAGRDGTVRVWEAGGSLRPVATLRVGTRGALATDVCWAASRKTLVVAADDATFSFHELHRGRFVYQGRLQGHTDDLGVPLRLAWLEGSRGGMGGRAGGGGGSSLATPPARWGSMSGSGAGCATERPPSTRLPVP